MEKSLIKQTIRTQILEIINLKYETFLKMIDELNSIAEYFLDDEGYRLTFRIAEGTDVTFLWKLTVRVECSKSKENSENVASVRLLNLNQLLNVHSTIKQQAETLKTFQLSSDTGASGECTSKLEQSSSNDKKESQQTFNVASTSGGCDSLQPTFSQNQLKEPKLYDMIQSMHETVNDEEICCICMEEKANIILTCTHNFCEKCIKEWKISSQTCPICRKRSANDDCFILTDKPDYYNLQDEMSKSLFQIAESSNDRNKRSTRSANNSVHRHDRDIDESD